MRKRTRKWSFPWSLSLLDAKIILDSLWTHLEAMSLSRLHKRTLSRTCVVYAVRRPRFRTRETGMGGSGTRTGNDPCALPGWNLPAQLQSQQYKLSRCRTRETGTGGSGTRTGNDPCALPGWNLPAQLQSQQYKLSGCRTRETGTGGSGTNTGNDPCVMGHLRHASASSLNSTLRQWCRGVSSTLLPLVLASEYF